MQGTRFTHTIHLHGTLGANATGNFVVPCPCSLESVSVGASNAASATLEVGTSADRDGILDAVACGQSDTPTLFTASNFNGALAVAGEPYHVAAGTIIAWDLDYDGASGTAGQNITIVMTFTEG